MESLSICSFYWLQIKLDLIAPYIEPEMQTFEPIACMLYKETTDNFIVSEVISDWLLHAVYI